MIESFLMAGLIGLGLIVLNVGIFYEILAHTWINLPRWESRPRLQIIITIVACFVAHTIAVWVFGIAYYVLENHAGFGGLAGNVDRTLLGYVYFSGVTYSSLGFGDVYPTGNLRLLVAVEAILGLVLIGWTVAFTYLCTEKYLTHRLKRHGKRRR